MPCLYSDDVKILSGEHQILDGEQKTILREEKPPL